MPTITEMLKIGAAGSVLVVAVLFSGNARAPAQGVDLEQQILKALTPKPTERPRSLTAAPAETSRTADRAFLDSLKGRSSHSLTSEERERISELAKGRPNVDLEVNFEYGSAKIGTAAVPTVTSLGRALTNAELKGGRFVVAGYTDAKGSYPFNQQLSEQRADSVKRYLVDHFQIPTTTLVTVGYGRTGLKNESDPFGAENRRVQIINLEEKSISER
jgi:outer membrane protein OmpA-like peptidoglycan-associated protein